MLLTTVAVSPALMAGTVELSTSPRLGGDVDAPVTPTTECGGVHLIGVFT